MYFCKIDNALFVLHYGEVRKIIHEITGDAGKALTYNVRYAFDPGHVKRNDKLVEDYLQGLHKNKPEELLKYFERSNSEALAVEAFFLLLLGYNLIHQRVYCNEMETYEKCMSDPVKVFDWKMPETVTIAVYYDVGSFFNKRELSTSIEIATEDFGFVEGNVYAFSLKTKGHRFDFDEKGISVTLRY